MVMKAMSNLPQDILDIIKKHNGQISTDKLVALAHQQHPKVPVSTILAALLPLMRTDNLRFTADKNVRIEEFAAVEVAATR